MGQAFALLTHYLDHGATHRHPVLAFQQSNHGATDLARGRTASLRSDTCDRAFASLYTSRACHGAGIFARDLHSFPTRLSPRLLRPAFATHAWTQPSDGIELPRYVRAPSALSRRAPWLWGGQSGTPAP